MKLKNTISFILISLFIGGLLLPNTVKASVPQQQLDSAIIYYDQSQYQKAIDIYESLISQRIESAELYYNLGNAYYKVKNVPLAIANYERALKLDPNDEDTKFNLRLVKAQTVDKIDSIEVFFIQQWIDAIVGLAGTNAWAIWSIFTFVLSLAILLLFFFSHSIRLKKWSFSVSIILLVISLLSLSASYRQKTLMFDTQYAVIVHGSVNIKSSPDDNSTSIFILHSGTKMQVLDQIQEWYKVKIDNGNTGWVKTDDVEMI
ncbi:MAG: tetratricopeptide repeat protein [Bacteroidales bacterium]|nr:tetratricopeptide repeat protein [Bacteroidales bacterium]